MPRDYYVSATVRPIGTTLDWCLWVTKINANDAAHARDAALALLHNMELTHGQIDMLWDESSTRSASAILHQSALPCGCDPGIDWICEVHRAAALRAAQAQAMQKVTR